MVFGNKPQTKIYKLKSKRLIKKLEKFIFFSAKIFHRYTKTPILIFAKHLRNKINVFQKPYHKIKTALPQFIPYIPLQQYIAGCSKRHCSTCLCFAIGVTFLAVLLWLRYLNLSYLLMGKSCPLSFPFVIYVCKFIYRERVKVMVREMRRGQYEN